MGWVYFLIFVVIAIAIGIGLYKGKENADRWNAEKAQGNFAERKNKFWDEETYFYTNATYEEVKKQVLNNSFSSAKVTAIPDYEGYKAIFFNPNPRYFTSFLEYVGEKNGKHFYKYYIYSYTDNKLGIVMGDMNIVQTKIEKIFLSLDTGTMIETHTIQRHTKRSWF
jgi:hypothetical protein